MATTEIDTPVIRFSDLWVWTDGVGTFVICEGHAAQYAYEREATWDIGRTYADGNDGVEIYREQQSGLEADAPQVCESCLRDNVHMYLRTDFTNDGLAYLAEHDFPAEVLEWYLGSDWEEILAPYHE